MSVNHNNNFFTGVVKDKKFTNGQKILYNIFVIKKENYKKIKGRER